MSRRNPLFKPRVACLLFLSLLLGACANLTDVLAEQLFLPKDARPATYDVRTREAAMQTSDGVTLTADIHAPVGPTSTPTILVRIPFNDELWNRLRSDSIGRYWAKRGYTVVVQGTRGRYRSEGTFYPAVNEERDGRETIEWLKTQPWFDGRLAMWGGSGFGHTQWAVSDLAEEGPDAFAIQIASTSYYSTFYHGGAFALESALYWGLVSPPERDRPTSGAEIQKGADGWPVIEADDRALKDVTFFNDWATHRTNDAYWRSIDGTDRAMKVSAPVLMLGGWYDPFLPSMLEDFTRLTTENPHPLARQSRIIIGPYIHAGEIEWPGAKLDAPYRTASIQPVLNWFDHWLGTAQASLRGAPVRIFVLGDNVWRDENEWPLARTQYTPFYFHSNGALDPKVPSPGERPIDWVYDPQNPVPTRGGAMLGPRSGIFEQDAALTRSDVITFETQPLEMPLEVTGPISALLYVSTDAPSTDFTVKLLDVHPNGEAYNIADGIVRKNFSPDVAQEIEVLLNPTSVVFPAGHRIRIDVSSSNFPRFDRNPNTGEDPATAVIHRPARQTLHLERQPHSQIVLPVIPRDLP
ncbi:MAG: CocE/NonD family hydrolase [Hyphomonadaceae bacterium]